MPGSGGDGAAGRRHRPASRVRRGPRHVRSGGEAGRGVLDVLDGEACADDDEDERGGAPARPAPAGAVVRPRAVAQPRITPGAWGAAAASHAVLELRGVRDDDDDERRRARREGAGAAEPFCLREREREREISYRPTAWLKASGRSCSISCAPRRAVRCAVA